GVAGAGWVDGVADPRLGLNGPRPSHVDRTIATEADHDRIDTGPDEARRRIDRLAEGREPAARQLLELDEIGLQEGDARPDGRPERLTARVDRYPTSAHAELCKSSIEVGRYPWRQGSAVHDPGRRSRGCHGGQERIDVRSVECRAGLVHFGHCAVRLDETDVDSNRSVDEYWRNRQGVGVMLEIRCRRFAGEWQDGQGFVARDGHRTRVVQSTFGRICVGNRSTIE